MAIFDLPPKPISRVAQLATLAVILTRRSTEATRWDLYSCQAATALAKEQCFTDTSMSYTTPCGIYRQVILQSGLVVKHQISIDAGVINSDY